MTKYGVVGTGYFGAELARFMSKVEGAKITAISGKCGSDSERVELCRHCNDGGALFPS